MSENVLVVIDIQGEYISPTRPFFISSIQPSLANAKTVLNYARKSDWDIVHVKHLQAGSIFTLDSEFSEFVEGFAPLPQETTIVKNNYSCFSSADFVQYMEARLGSLIHVIGYGSTMCCLSTIIDGYHRGYRMNFLYDASAAKKAGAFTEDTLHSHATEIMRTFSNVVKTSDICNTNQSLFP